MDRYTVGYAFDGDATTSEHVVLIQKEAPQWQAGLFNGVGGKVEPGEDFKAAMSREFHEEAGLLVPVDRWDHFCTITRPGDFELRYYRSGGVDVDSCRTMEEEVIFVARLHDLAHLPMLPNARWAAYLALDTKYEGVVEVTY